MPQSFEVNRESVTIFVNGFAESTAVEVEEVDADSGIYFGRTPDGVLAAVEIFGPVRISDEKSPMRVATRMMREESLNEAMGTDKSPETMSDTAHRTAAEAGTGYQQRVAGRRGEGAVNPESDNEEGNVRGGMVVNPNATRDAGKDTMDANARDRANGSEGRHGVSSDHEAISAGGEENHADAEMVANPERAGQSENSRREEAAGDNKTAKEQMERGQEEAQKKVDNRSDALASSGDVLGNNSEAARLAETNSEEEEQARKDEKKPNEKDQVATVQQDDANAESSSSKKSRSAKSAEEKA